jgi:hypothetical protein
MAKLVITKQDILLLKSRREELEKLKTLQRQLEVEVNEREALIMAAIDGGQNIKGAVIQSYMLPCRPPWKEVHKDFVVLHMPDINWATYEEAVRRDYPPGEARRLVLSE